MVNQERLRQQSGLLENITQFRGILQTSPDDNRDVCMAFLDVGKDIDNIKDDQLKRTLDASFITSN